MVWIISSFHLVRYLNDSGSDPRYLPEIKQLISQFGKIGNNLNQIARYFNQGGIISSEMKKEIRKALRDIYEMKYDMGKMVREFRARCRLWKLAKLKKFPYLYEIGDVVWKKHCWFTKFVAWQCFLVVFIYCIGVGKLSCES